MKSHWTVTKEPIAGYTLTNIFRLLVQNRFRIHPKYFLRFLYGIGVSLLLWPLRMWEVLTKSHVIRRAEPVHDPVFIIGYYRSGTTYLITLFSKDPQRGYISNIEGYLPATFLGAPRFTRWLVSASLPEQRPMDNVVMTAEEPTEEEYSIGAYEKYSIYNGFIFPRNFRLYSRYNSFDGLPNDLKRWKKRWAWFNKKMAVKYQNKQMVYKNPTATFRIRHLLEMYPNAKFIHIYRNPYHIFSSNVKYHNEVFDIYTLQNWDEEEMQQVILENYREMYEKYNRDRSLIPEGNLIDIKYEDFIRNPLAHMKRIYKELGLYGYEEAEPYFKEHISTQTAYMPNKHYLGVEYVNKVNSYWSSIIDQLGYTKIDPQSAPLDSRVEIPR
jgi:omega-hydroxy-beta-dihydromenaquinone-9 sulfotransferase